MAKMKFYSTRRIDETGAVYRFIIGERSNGKSYACLSLIVNQYCASGAQGAIIRRWADDLKGKRGQAMFDSLVANGAIEKASDGKWTNVHYYAGKWYMCRYDDDKRIVDETPFCYGFALTAMEHDKSTSYPNVKIIVFDEVLTRNMYLPDEFVIFMNVLSTIIRQRNDVIIYMLGNTVNQYCPYFNEMGLKHVADMKPGTIDVYTYGESELRVAVERCDTLNKEGKPSDMYFAFDNPRLNMITGGAWEIDIYPHCPVKYRPKEIIFTFFIQFDQQMLQCEIVSTSQSVFIFIHRKTSEIKDPDTALIYSTEWSHKPNWRRVINRPCTSIERKIVELFRNDKVFYQDNDTGEVVRNYLNWCKSQ